MSVVSQSRSHPAEWNIAAMIPAVKPQITRSSCWNAGPVQPLVCRSRNRLAGSSISSTGTVITREVSPGSTTSTSIGSRQKPSTGATE